MSSCILDVETDGLDYTKIHCAVALDTESNKAVLFLPKQFQAHEIPKIFKTPEFTLKQVSDLPAWGKSINRWIMHNGIAFDVRALKKILGLQIPLDETVDTLILSRLLLIERSKHSVAAYGEQFGVAKPTHEDWSRFSWDMLWRCYQDTIIQKKIYKYLCQVREKMGTPWECLELEQAVQWIMLRQADNGFYLDPEKTPRLYALLSQKHAELTEKIQGAFPTQAKLISEVIPREKKDGTWHTVDTRYFEAQCDALMPEGYYATPDEILAGPYSRITFASFNLDSPKQRVDRLVALGWKPTERTATGAPKFTENSLKHAPKDIPKEAKLLGEYLMVASRMRTVKQWLDLKDDQGYVHGQVITLGARTHRMGHRAPNMGNVPRVGSIYGKECRECWTVEHPEVNTLLGCDASSIQLRALAHYADDAEYTKKVCYGDIHSVHAEALGCSRNAAKTWIYAWLLNAGPVKLGSVLGGDVRQGKHSMKIFLDRMPFLGKVKETFEGYAEGSAFVALDGRRIHIPSAHLSLSTGLQSFERIVMAWVMREYHRDMMAKGIPFWQRNCIHDELQIEVAKKHADMLGKHINGLFEKAGEALGSKCPLAGEYKTGQNWAETH